MKSSFDTAAQVGNADIYTNLAGLQQLKTLGKQNNDEALLQAARQFESIMIKMMLKGARDANKVFTEGNPFKSSEQAMYQDMLDHQLSLSMSTSRGLGIAEAMVRQLRGDAPAVNTAGSVASGVSYAAMAKTASMDKPAAVQANAPVSAEPMHFDGSAEQFVRRLYPLAEQAGREIGVDAEVLLAQAALETGWGARMIKHPDGSSSNNLFNIKAGGQWRGDAVSVPTLEYREGVAVREQAAFRAYANPEQSFNDYVEFLRGNERYRDALQQRSGDDFIRGLSEAGYATDPAYAEKILRILRSEPLQQAAQQYAGPPRG